MQATIVPHRNTGIAIRPRTLTLQDLQTISVPFEIKDGFLVLEKSLRGWPLRRPVRVALETVLEAREKGLVEYVLQAFGSERSTLIPWVFENQSLLKLARHFLRRFSGSPMTLYTYADTLSRYSRYLGHNPDVILQDVKNG